MADDDWDLDTDEIRSLDSEELHERRPNRWTGAPSTWASWTRQDRKTHAALETATAQDLAVHLYNAAALKRGRLGQQDEDEDRRRGKWVGERWTAWPLPADEVPSDELLPRTLDKHERATFRRPSPGFPGSHLEEEVSATMLRFAKERFLRRGLRSQAAPVVESVETSDEGEAKDEDEDEETEDEDDEDDDEDEDEDQEEAESRPSSRGRSRDRSKRPRSESIKEESATVGSRTSLSRLSVSRTPRRHQLPNLAYTVVPSADDDQSYTLLRPAARRILATLDETLTILHNARASRPRSGDEDGIEAEAGPIKRGKGSTRQATPKRKTGPALIQQPPKGRGGRPRKALIPLEGETEQDMLVRVARERKQRLPDFYHEKEAERKAALRASTERSRSASPDSRASSRSGVASRGSASRASSASSDQSIVERRVRKCLPRDWHHVMGAAALAGFSPAVVERATQRCATLFGQGMTMHTLLEQPAGAHGMLPATYSPGPIDIPPSDDSDEELEQSRVVGRVVSLQNMRRSSEAEEPATTPNRQSATPGPAREHRCLWDGCPGAIKGFSRVSNLNRHVRKVHGGKAVPDVGEQDQPRAISRQSMRPSSPEAEAATRQSTPGPAGEHRCLWDGCPGAIKGFSRASNLNRHVRKVHGGKAVPDVGEQDQPRAISRQSMRPSSPEAEAATRQSTPGPAGEHRCLWDGCPGAIKGFSRASNLNRHVRKVHGGKAVPDVGEQDQPRAISRQSMRASSPEAAATRPSTPGPAGSLLCPWAGCPGAVQGYSRLSNLNRHIRKIHDRKSLVDVEVSKAAVDVEVSD
ncbi:hypothetical protein B0T24DRAFT_587261 [Lasiosphaeria ovina]|uniref:C2H2-type domain-containing protein n=1 Tax=Lasiosphaeria ovina TaxID=92902 RepID=A0AAE0NJ68_9PEZI|nr:hypothetical protein B0T24DRAFT_587261 [Lasiosphaeria ovina]